MSDNRQSFLDELKQRKVVRTAIAYVTAAFVVLEGADLLLSGLGAPAWVLRTAIVLALVGRPAALVASWLVDLTPGGVVLARSGRRILRPGAAFGLLAGAGFLLLLALGWIGFRGLRADGVRASVAPDAQAIAVFPFSVRGSGLQDLREGMVDLLSRNLDEVGPVRTVDPRVVIRRFEAGAAAGPPSTADLLAMGRALGARSVVTGSIVEADGRVRIAAQMIAADGTPMASAEVDGAKPAILHLVDSLSVALLRSVWRAHAPVPRLDVASITTGDVGALAAYLEGERRFRASDWRGALQALEQAVARDSTFALAFYRLSRLSGWIVTPRERTWYVDQAERFAGRLPDRTRRLLRAEHMWVFGPAPAAVDSLAVLRGAYPDDPDVIQAYAVAAFHRRDQRAFLGARPLDERLAAFDRVLELDPAYLPALVQPLAEAFLAGDTQRIARYATLLAAVPSVSGDVLQLVRDGRVLVAGSGSPAMLTATVLRTLDAGGDQTSQLRQAVAEGLLPALVRRALQLPRDLRQPLEQALRERFRDPHGPARSAAGAALLQILIGGGELEAARQCLQGQDAREVLDDGTRQRFARLPVLLGLATRPLLPDPRGDMAAADPRLRFLVRLDRGDAAGARAAALDLAAARRPYRAGIRVGVPRHLDGEPPPEPPDPLARAALALATAEANPGRAAGADERSTALARAELALRQVQPWDEPELAEAFWLRWVERLVASGTDPERARTLLDRPWPGTPAFEPRRRAILARIR